MAIGPPESFGWFETVIQADHPPTLPTNNAAAAAAVIAAARALLDGTDAARPFLRGWPDLEATRPLAPSSVPVLAWLDAARRSTVPPTAPLVDALATHADALTWQRTYTATDFGVAFLERYGWTELIGSRGPIPSETVACGILMLGPGTDYPSHSHEAEELYLPLAGTADWTRGHEAAVERPPGIPIHHPSWIPHAMRTGAEPLLALYVWRGGDLAAKPRIVGRPERDG